MFPWKFPVVIWCLLIGKRFVVDIKYNIATLSQMQQRRTKSVRLNPETWRNARIAAAYRGKSLTDWVDKVVNDFAVALITRERRQEISK